MHEENNEIDQSYGTVPYRKVERALQQLASVAAKTGHSLDEIQISFEYLIGSFFPEVVENINTEMNKQYTRGYLDGRKECEDNADKVSS